MEDDEKLSQSCRDMRDFDDYVERMAVETAAAERQRYGSSSSSSWHRPQPQQAEAWLAAPEALITVPTMDMDGKDMWVNNPPASSNSAPASIPSPLFASTAENWEGLAGGDTLAQAATPQLDLALNSPVNGIESAGNPGLMMNASLTAGLGVMNHLLPPQNDYAMIRARLHARLQEVMPEVSNDRRLVADIVEGYRPMAQPRRQRSAKKPIPDDQKDEQYFIRRARNNKAAKKSRDGRKKKEDGVMIAVTFLQQEQDDMEKKFAFLQQRIELLNEFGILKNRLMARRGPRRMDLNLPMPQVKSVPVPQSESPYLVRDKAKMSAALMKGAKYSQMKKQATPPPQVMMQPHEELTLLEDQHLQQLLQDQQQQQSQLLLKQLSPLGMQQQEPQLLQPELLGSVLPQDMQQQQQQPQQERPPQQSDMLMKQLLPQEMQMHLKQEEQLHSQLMMQQMQAETMQPQKLQHQQYPQHEQQYQQQQPASLHEQQYQQQQQQQEPSTPLHDQQLNLTVSLPSYF